MSTRTKLDPKVAFYLKHQEQIDEWIDLRERAIAESNRFFKALAPAVEGLVQQLEGAKPLISLDENKPKLFLYRVGWVDSAAASPRAAIGLEWAARKTLFANAYSGVWVDMRLEGGRQLQQTLEPSLASYRKSDPSVKTDAWWPAWRYECPAAPDYWENLDALREQILTSLSRWWTGCAAVVNRAIAESAGGAGA